MSSLIVAYNKKRTIGLNNEIPWYYSEDLKHFKTITSGSYVVMGRKTYESILQRCPKGLPNRTMTVLTSNKDYKPKVKGVIMVYSLEELETFISDKQRVFIIGGATLYNHFLAKVKTLYITKIPTDTVGDTFFPRIPSNFYCSEYHQKEDLVYLTYKQYKPNSSDETGYLGLLQEILTTGEKRYNRTGVNTVSIFGAQMKFDIRYSLPLLTTKRVFWKTVIKELLWFLTGSTDNKTLLNQNVNIWTGNSTKPFLESRGLDYEEHDIGPGYGFQWKHWGAKYVDCDMDYSGQGVDQIQRLIDGLINDPNSRRHILTAWNVADIDKMALPPCHILAQFYVDAKKQLSCQLYQRSGDVFLGVPFNIASYSILTYILAKICGYTPGYFIHTIGDAHIYENHISQCREQLTRIPSAFPKLELSEKFTKSTNWSGITIEDFKIVNYECDSYIKADMVV